MSPRISLLTMCISTFLLGACSATEVTQTAWSASPEGEWLTRIAQSDTSGFGNNYLSETVQLKRRTASEPVDILTLEKNDGAATIKLHWRDPTHLILEHAGGRVVWQVVKVGELSIETRELVAANAH